MLKFLNSVLIIIISLFIILAARVSISKKAFWNSNKSNEPMTMLESNVKIMDLFFQSVEQTPQQIANLLEIKKISVDEMHIIMNSTLINIEIFGTCIAFEPNQCYHDQKKYAPFMYKKGDSIVHKNLGDNDYEYFYQDWYLIPKILQKSCWSEPYYDDGGGDSLMITYSVPFFFFDGLKKEFAGVVTIDISINWLVNFFNNEFDRLPENGYSMMISENGTVITAPNKDWVYNQTIYSLAQEQKMDMLREIGKEINKKKNGKKTFYNKDQNKRYDLYYSVIPSCSWGIIYVISKDY